MNLKLTQNTVLITGGSSGIGKAITKMYAEEPGIRIAFTYHTNEEAASILTTQLKQQGVSVVAVPMDLEDHESIGQAVNKVVDVFGSIDALVNNAVFWGSPGFRGMGFEDIPIEEWEKIFRINLLGTVKMIQTVIPFMKKNNFGRIVNISSDIALDSMPGSGPYGMMKAALSGLTANLVTEYSAHNILSNLVIPSLTFTDEAKKRFPEAFQEAAKKAFPTNRVTRPEDVASLVAYLGSGTNTHVNGEQIRVTGKGSQPMLNALYHS
ncbi:MAG: SDR family oxidoreductase [Salibacteraceae bacterium]